MEIFAKIANGSEPLTTFGEGSNLDVWMIVSVCDVNVLSLIRS